MLHSEDYYSLPSTIVPALGSCAVISWRQDYRRHRLGSGPGVVGRASALWQRGTPTFKLFDSLACIKDQLRDHQIRAQEDCNDATISDMSSTVREAASLEHGQADVTQIASTTCRAVDPWEALEQTQVLVKEFRLAYRRHRMGGSVGAKGELVHLVDSLNNNALRLLPAAQVHALLGF